MNASKITDGRTARRNRNRDAVLDAMIALTTETGEEPAIEAVAERAGVSYRSVYRYFDDRTELLLAAIGRLMGEVWPIFDIEHLGEGTFDERLERLIRARIGAYRRLAPLTRLAMRRSVSEPVVTIQFDSVREFLREQIRTQFATELSAVPDAERVVAVRAIDVMFQFEALEFLARFEGLDDHTIAEVLRRQVRVHLAVD
jgi:AcrR family transcriptional regulator